MISDASSLDVQDLVSKLMLVESKKLHRFELDEKMLHAQHDQLEQFKSLLSNFKTILETQSKALTQTFYAASSSNESIVSASATGNTLPVGTHTLTINNLATASQISSQTYLSATTALSITDTIQITQGTNAPVAVSINSTDTLENIRDNINMAAGSNTFSAYIVSSTAVDGSTQYNLVVGSANTGVANALTITDASLQLSNTLQAAQDAQFTFDSFAVTRGSNTINDLIQGLTLNLNASSGSAIINISESSSQQQNMIATATQSFVNAYNQLIDFIDKTQASAFLSDSIFSTVKTLMQNTKGQTFGGDPAMQYLLNMGVISAGSEKHTSDKGTEYVSTGKLAVNETAFLNAVNTNPEEVIALLNGPTGFFSSLLTVLTPYTQSFNLIDQRENFIGKQESTTSHRIMNEESRLKDVEIRLKRKYAALNANISRYADLSKMLEKQFFSTKN